jgi:O-antigen/teichoic acid export membrane protein
MSIVRHTSYNFAGAVVPILVSLITVPLYLQVIGFDRYGILALVWLVVGYFNLFDFGLGRATAQQVASSTSEQDRNAAFWTALFLAAAFALLATIVAAPVALIVFRAIKVTSSELRSEIVESLPALIAAIPIWIMQGVVRGALEGRRRFLAINVIQSGGAVATAVVPLLTALVVGPELPDLVLATLLVRGVVLLALSVAAKRSVPIRGAVWPGRTYALRLVRFGAWLTITNVVGPIMMLFDRFLIGAIAGAAAVAVYVIPFTLISQLALFPSSLSSAVFPKFAADSAMRTRERDELVRMTAFLMTPAACAAVVLVGPFLHVWLGADIGTKSTPVAIVLMIGFWANGVAQLPFASLHAVGRTDTTAKLHLIEVVPYLLVLWAGLKIFGLAGAAAAWSLRATADLLALIALDGVDRAVLRSIFVQLGGLIAVAASLLVTDPQGAVRWILVSITFAIVAMHLFRNAPDKLRDQLRECIVRAHVR